MKRIAILFAGLLAAGCATTQPPAAPGSETFTMSAETVAHCQANGGCYPVTLPEMLLALEKSYEMGAADGAAAMQQACQRGAR